MRPLGGRYGHCGSWPLHVSCCRCVLMAQVDADTCEDATLHSMHLCAQRLSLVYIHNRIEQINVIAINIIMVKRNQNLNSPNPTKHQVAEADVSPPPEAEVVIILQQSDCAVVKPDAQEHPPASVSVIADDTTSTPEPPASVQRPPSPPVSPVAVPRPPSSPGNNRAAFFSQHVPSRVMCDMNLCRSSPGAKVALSAVVIAVFDANANPERRYVQLADATGSVGITVWNSNVARLTRDTIGRVLKLGKVVVGNHHGKKVLTMTRESTLEFDDSHPLNLWWQQIAQAVPVRLASVNDVADNGIINVAGILGMIVAEPKMVGSASKTLLTLHLVDVSGQLDIRSWNHEADDFVAFTEKPILIHRIRVTSYAGKKMGELLDNNGSIISTEFAGQKVLQQFWAD